jgi:hypothetical protein
VHVDLHPLCQMASRNYVNLEGDESGNPSKMASGGRM